MKRRESWIDSLKGLLILVVIMPHCGLYDLPGKVGVLCGFGRYFILPFFILSSYLSFGSYRRYLSEGKTWATWLFHRIVRLCPLYFCALLPAFFMGGRSFWHGGEQGISFFNVLTHLTFTNGFFPYYCNSILGVEWYIAALVVFYLFVPLLSKLVNSFERSIILLLSSVFISSFLIRIIVRHYAAMEMDVVVRYFQQFSFWAEIPILSMGICLYYAKPFLNRLREKNNRILAIVILISSLVLLYGQAFSKSYLYRVEELYLSGVFMLGFVLAFFIGNFKVLSNPILAFIGRHSYPIYLFHILFIDCFDWASQGVAMSVSFGCMGLIVKYVVVLAITLAFSILSVKYVEEPFLRLLEK